MSLTVTTVETPSPEQWLALGEQPSIFLSSAWLPLVLQRVKTKVASMTARQRRVFGQGTWLRFAHGDLTTGYCYLHARRAPFDVPRVYLNQTGNLEFDQSWIEFNDIASLDGYREMNQHALLGYLNQQHPYTLFTVSMTQGSWPINDEWMEWDTIEHIGHYTDLTAIQQPGSLLEQVSSNTKQTLKRSLKFLKREFGNCALQRIEPHEQLTTFDQLGNWHRERWQHTKEGSGFDNAEFIQFHRQLIAEYPDNVGIFSFTAGGQVLGYLYCLEHGDTANFYLSSIKLDGTDNKYKPGLVMHWFAIEWYAAQGFVRYDFLAGDMQYKRSLASDSYRLCYLQLAPNNGIYRMLKGLHRLKRSMLA